MGKDWVVWVVCLLLFCTGAVWGGIQIPTDFFVMKSLHELSETIGGFASAAALIAAVMGVTAWKNQLRASADHELARKLAVSVIKYKSAVKSAWGLAELALGEINKVNGGVLSGDFYEHLMRDTLDSNEAKRYELEAILLECDATKFEGASACLSEALAFQKVCHDLCRMFLRSVNAGNEIGREIALFSADSYVKALSGLDISCPEHSEIYVNRLFVGIESLLNKKMLL